MHSYLLEGTKLYTIPNYARALQATDRTVYSTFCVHNDFLENIVKATVGSCDTFLLFFFN